LVMVLSQCNVRNTWRGCGLIKVNDRRSGTIHYYHHSADSSARFDMGYFDA